MTKSVRLEIDPILTVDNVINIINNKRFDCVNYGICLEKLAREDLKKKETEEEEHHTWRCSSMCDDYIYNINNFSYKVYRFSEREIELMSEIDHMTTKERLRLFMSMISHKQNFEKRNGKFNVEESTRTTILDGRTKRNRIKRSKKQS